MAAALSGRPISVEPLALFEHERKLPLQLNTKTVIKLKLDANAATNRVSFECYNTTLRAAIGDYELFLDKDPPTPEEWRSQNLSLPNSSDGGDPGAAYVKFLQTWRARAARRLLW